MKKISILDCTLRDGGYVNDFKFGKETIIGFLNKIVDANIECVELGFLKGEIYNPDYTYYPDIDSIKTVLLNKCDKIKYFVMYDTSAPLDLEKIKKYDGTSIDGIRVIFKNDKIDEGYKACKKFIELGYIVSANFVSTDVYTDNELKSHIERFNELDLYTMVIVDTFGSIKKNKFMHIVEIFNKYMKSNITLSYHAHNNLQQAYLNAVSFVELNLDRDILIDASVFGMGRGAGNLNIELFAEYLNETKNKNYHIVPILEIMDEYIQDIYKNKFWGYSLPLYISGTLNVHPNYAIYLAEKNTLTEKSLYEVMNSISKNDRLKYKKDIAEKYYIDYMNNSIDDKVAIDELSSLLKGKKVFIIAPGKTINDYADKILNVVNNEEYVSISLNFYNEKFMVDFIFSSNMRRYNRIDGKIDYYKSLNSKLKTIITSNMREAINKDYMLNFYNLAVESKDIVDNAGIMVLKLLSRISVKEVLIAGMDGYNEKNPDVYSDETTYYDFSDEAEIRNKYISLELNKLKNSIDIKFLTPTKYGCY